MGLGIVCTGQIRDTVAIGDYSALGIRYMLIRVMQASDLETIMLFTVRAFVPVFESFKKIMGDDVFPIVYPDGVDGQRKVVQELVDNEEYEHWVMDNDGKAVGYLVTHINRDSEVGEIVYLVVDPNYHKQGIATALNRHAIDLMKEAGMKVATVSTGGDISHLPARQAYEKVGFQPFPNIWYYQSLE